jgi:hypothetical protein
MMLPKSSPQTNNKAPREGSFLRLVLERKRELGAESAAAPTSAAADAVPPLPGPAATDAPPRTSEAPRPAWRPWLRAVSQGWAHVYPDWSFAIGQQTIDIEPVPAVGHGWSGDCLHCIGTLAGEPFVLVMEPALASALARSADAAARFPPASPRDAGLVLDHLLTPLIERIERAAGGELVLDSVEVAPPPPSYALLPARVRIGEATSMAGFAGGAALMARMGRMVAASARPAESAIADRLAVAIGPIAIAAGRTAELIAGDLIDCGVDPAGDVRGLLCRSDGSFWPILIEGDQVVVCGPVQSPAAIATAKELLATLEIGSVELRARQRISLEAGDRIPFARAAANSARMRLAHGGEVAGGLELIDGVLAFRASGEAAGR